MNPSGKRSKEPSSGGGDKPRDRVHLALLIVLLVLTIIYFRLHLREWVTGFALLGGTFTLWTLWKLVQSLLGEWAGFDPKALTFRLLRRPRACEHLIFALCVLALLLAVTSSIYVEHDASVGPEYEVEVLRDGDPYVEPIAVRSSDRIAGRPFLFAGSRELEFRVREMGDFRPQSRTVKSWTAVRIGRFQRKRLFVLRLVPGISLRNSLPRPDDQPQQRYELRAKVDGRDEKPIDDLRRGIVLLGAGSDDLERVHENHTEEALTRLLTEYFTSKRVPTEDQEPLLVGYQRPPQYLPTAELAKDQKVELSVVRLEKGEDAEEKIACLEVQMDEVAMDQIRTVILERGGCDEDV